MSDIYICIFKNYAQFKKVILKVKDDRTHPVFNSCPSINFHSKWEMRYAFEKTVHAYIDDYLLKGTWKK